MDKTCGLGASRFKRFPRAARRGGFEGAWPAFPGPTPRCAGGQRGGLISAGVDWPGGGQALFLAQGAQTTFAGHGTRFFLVGWPSSCRQTCHGIAQESLRAWCDADEIFQGPHCEVESETVFAPLQTCLRRDEQALFPAPAPSPPRRAVAHCIRTVSCHRAQSMALPAGELAPGGLRAANLGEHGRPAPCRGARLERTVI